MYICYLWVRCAYFDLNQFNISTYDFIIALEIHVITNIVFFSSSNSCWGRNGKYFDTHKKY